MERGSDREVVVKFPLCVLQPEERRTAMDKVSMNYENSIICVIFIDLE